jgi:NADH-quinone oxidoreductase subunit N
MTPFDFSSMAGVHRAEIVLVAAMLVLLGGAKYIDRSRVLSSLIGAVGLLAALACVVTERGFVRTGLVVATVAGLLAMLLLPEADLFASEQRPEAAALILVATTGAAVLCAGKNLLEIALGVEMLSLASATLIALGRGTRPLEAGFKYFVLTAASFAVLLFGMSLVFVATGSLAVPSVAAVAAGMRPLMMLGLALMSVGLLFKLAVAPLHFGPLDAYTAGSSSFVGFIMVVSKLGAAIALGRIAIGGSPLWSFLLVAGLLSLAVAVVASFAQTDLRRLLAYSAVAHAGFLAVALACEGGARGSLFYVVSYAGPAMLAFACLSGLPDGPLPLSSLRPGGGVSLSRVRAIGLMIALASLAGVPPFPGFWGKLAVLQLSWGTWGIWPTAAVALAGVMGIIYYLRPMPDLLAHAKDGAKTSTATTIAIVATAALTFATGLMPGFFYELLK